MTDGVSSLVEVAGTGFLEQSCLESNSAWIGVGDCLGMKSFFVRRQEKSREKEDKSQVVQTQTEASIHLLVLLITNAEQLCQDKNIPAGPG